MDTVFFSNKKIIRNLQWPIHTIGRLRGVIIDTAEQTFLVKISEHCPFKLRVVTKLN